MKKFKYKGAYIAKSVEERLQIGALLEEMGYRSSAINNASVCVGTGYRNQAGFYTTWGDGTYCGDRLCYNKDTFLALAATVDDDKFYKGEWVVCTSTSAAAHADTPAYTKGTMYQVANDSINGIVFTTVDDLGSTSNAYACFRKAIKEEIVDYFKGGKIVQMIPDKVIGYDFETGGLLNGLSLGDSSPKTSLLRWTRGESGYIAFTDWDMGIVHPTITPKTDLVIITQRKKSKHKLLVF